MDLDFVQPVLDTPTQAIRGMVRETDTIEAQRGAVDQLQGRALLQWRILQIIATEGPQTDRELELRAEFRGYGPSTVRKRRSELAHMEPPKLVKVGRRDKLSLWGIA